MVKTTLIICLAFITFKSFAQTVVVDSLEEALIKHPQKDTVKLNILNDLAFYFRSTDPQKGLESADEAISLSMLLHDRSKLAIAYNNKGANYDAQGNGSMAIKCYQRCLQIRKKLKDQKGIAIVMHNLGISYFNLSNYEKALDYQQQSYEIFYSISHKSGMAATLNSLGVVYLYLSDYPRALNYYLKALHIYEKTEDKYNVGTTFNNIGLVYDHLGNFDKALEYHFKALNIFKRLGHEYDMQNALANMGNTYDNSGKPMKALDFYQQALAINKKLENKRGIASDLINTGIVYYGIAQYDKALDYLQKSLALYEQLDDKYGKSIALSYISKAYFKAPRTVLIKQGLQPSQSYMKAVSFQQKGLKLAQEIGNLQTQSEAWENLSEIYQKRKEYDKAYDAYKNHIVLRDSMLNDEKKSEITRMSMQYDFDKKQATAMALADKKQALAAATIERQRLIKNAIAGGSGILLIAAFTSFVFYKRKRDAEGQQREAELKAEVADTEMKALRAQMNPHFIFNSLNSISDFINKHDTETADHYLTKFARLMRMTLENSEQKEIPLADDLKALEIYMQLEALRLDHKFTYEIQVKDNIDQENTLVPPLMLQPFVENSIWHGIAQKQGKGKILIEIRKEEEMINCVVEDNGVGIKDKHRDQIAQKSLGMRITRSRMAMINKLKKANATLEYANLVEGMRVELKLPLTLSF